MRFIRATLPTVLALCVCSLLGAHHRSVAAQKLPPNVIRTAKGELLPAPGYTWLGAPPGDTRVRWLPGKPHPEKQHVVASDAEGYWGPAPGYAWVSLTAGDFRVRRLP